MVGSMEKWMVGWMDEWRTWCSNAQRNRRTTAGWNAWWSVYGWGKLAAGWVIRWVDGWRAG